MLHLFERQVSQLTRCPCILLSLIWSQQITCHLEYPGCGRFGRPSLGSVGGDGGGNVDFEDRIINGEEVTQERPWMARVVYVTEKKKSLEVCGASVITRYFLLSAAHCFCNAADQEQRFPGLADCVDGNVGKRKLISGAAAGHHRVLVGFLNTRDRSRQSLRVASVHLHPNVSLQTEPWSHDLALVRMRAPLTFSARVAPICLPGGDTRELFQQVFVAGWGVERSAENTEIDPCATNQYGPKKFARCQASLSNPGGKIKCSKAPHPSDPSCESFFHSVELDAFVDIAIVENVSCYPTKHGTYGWCHTKPSAQASSRDWGFCFFACQRVKSNRAGKQLREVELSVLDPYACDLPGQKIDFQHELCIGYVPRKPMVATFRRSQARSAAEPFKMVAATAAEFYDFIGFKGDSGGPYYKFESDSAGRKRAILLSIISRGQGCADQNSPGIGGRVKKAVPWIRQVTGEAFPEAKA